MGSSRQKRDQSTAATTPKMEENEFDWEKYFSGELSEFEYNREAYPITALPEVMELPSRTPYEAWGCAIAVVAAIIGSFALVGGLAYNKRSKRHKTSSDSNSAKKDKPVPKPSVTLPPAPLIGSLMKRRKTKSEPVKLKHAGKDVIEMTELAKAVGKYKKPPARPSRVKLGDAKEELWTATEDNTLDDTATKNLKLDQVLKIAQALTRQDAATPSANRASGSGQTKDMEMKVRTMQIAGSKAESKARFSLVEKNETKTKEGMVVATPMSSPMLKYESIRSGSNQTSRSNTPK